MEWKISKTPVDYETAIAEMERRVEDILAGRAPELVNLTNVIVPGVDNIGTTMNADANKGFWVADAAAGAENNGVYVFLGTVPSAMMPSFLTIGAHVNVTGSATEFDLGTPPRNDRRRSRRSIRDQPWRASLSDGRGPYSFSPSWRACVRRAGPGGTPTPARARSQGVGMLCAL